MDSYQQHLICLKKIFPRLSYSTIGQQVRRAGSGRNVRLSVIQEIVASDKNNSISVCKSDEEILKAIFADSSVDPKAISHLISVLAPVPNRLEVICRLLCDRLDKKNRKRPNTELPAFSSEATTSKQLKITDSSDEDEGSVIDIRSNEASGQMRSNLSVVIKKDRNGNRFTQITSSSSKKSSAPSPAKTKASPVIIPQGINETNHHNGLKNNELFPPDFQVAGRSDSDEGNQLLETAQSIDMLNKLVPRGHADELEVMTVDDDSVIDLEQSVVAQDELAEKSQEAASNNFQPNPPQEELPLDQTLVSKLMEVFPDACPNYIKSQCRGQIWSEWAFGNIAEIILSSEYPKRPERTPSPDVEVDPREQLAMLKAVLPDADPCFLEEKVEQFGGDNEAVRQFIETAMELRNYPTMKEYLRKKQLCAQQKQYTTEFDVGRFVEIFPDPVSVFEDPNRKSTIIDDMDKYYVKCFMRNKYSQIYVKDVNSVVDRYSHVNVMAIVKQLDSLVSKGYIKKSKHVVPMAKIETQNIPLLQELAYVDYKPNILKYMEVKKQQDAEERATAKELGLLQSCNCCFDDEVMPLDILTCTGGCRFCRDCIRRSTEVAFGDRKTDYPCLSADCQSEFSLQVLQNVLPPKVFSKLAQKKALAEVKAAGVEDLVSCPFCDFANIPDPEDKLFRCLNPDCMKESCRLCKEPSHVPLRCDEVEKDAAVKARTFIENKMTEALVRECWKCGAKFIKEEGCNKMTCSCGAAMCYVCRKPVTNYAHFNGQGGDRLDLCPLYTENSLVNEKNVLQAAEEAKKQVDQAQLLNDPTAGLDQLFGNKVRDAEMRQKRANDLAATAMMFQGIPRMPVVLDPNRLENRGYLRFMVHNHQMPRNPPGPQQQHHQHHHQHHHH